MSPDGRDDAGEDLLSSFSALANKMFYVLSRIWTLRRLVVQMELKRVFSKRAPLQLQPHLLIYLMSPFPLGRSLVPGNVQGSLRFSSLVTEVTR